MQLIKKNIWSLFFITFIFATLLLGILSFNQYKEIKKDYTSQNENFTLLIAKSTENYFQQINVILELLGEQLLENDNYKNVIKSKELFKKMFRINDSIIAYALISPEGKYLLTHLDMPVENIPNVFTRKAAKDTFLESLKTHDMVIGRTYFLNRTKRMAIPIRKTFFDKDGKPVAVMSVAIPVDNTSLFDEEILKSYSHIIHLFREKDKYRQLYIYKTKDEKEEDIYTKPLPLKAYEFAISSIEKNYNKPISYIKENQKVVSFEFINRVNNHKYIISTKYIKKHELWATSYVRYDEFVNKFLELQAIYILIYFIVLTILWWLFNYINKSEEKQKKVLEYKANFDDLTSLPNKNYLNQNIKDWTKKKKSFTLIYLDLDNFKYVNDAFGHFIGDEVIKKVVSNIAMNLNTNDLFVRQSGDEFIILTKQTEDIETYCKNILLDVNRKIVLKNKEFQLSASLGVSSFPEDSGNFEELMICSDIACHSAKKFKNTYKIFNKNLKEEYLEKVEIEKELKTAIEKNEIYLVYQPQIKYDNSLHGVEALVRWENEKLGFIPPDKFINIAENCGLMPRIGNYIIDSSLKQIKKLQEKSSIDFNLSINISVKQFIEKDFYDKLMEKIEFYEVDPKWITLEVTESVFIDNLDYLTKLFNQLRNKGFTISLDDFGTGYSSLSMLRQLPINELKIDKAFVDDITHDESAQHMVETIISIGKILNYHIVLAEGVEEQKQVEMLNRFGCDTYQGYFYSKPLKIKELKEYITMKND